MKGEGFKYGGWSQNQRGGVLNIGGVFKYGRQKRGHVVWGWSLKGVTWFGGRGLEEHWDWGLRSEGITWFGGGAYGGQVDGGGA